MFRSRLNSQEEDVLPNGLAELPRLPDDAAPMHEGRTLSRVGGTGLKYEITQLTPSLNAIFSNTSRYPSQLLHYVTYR